MSEITSIASPARTTASHRVPEAVVLGLALAVRLAMVALSLVQFPKGWLFTRGTEMDYLAKSLLAGQGLSSPFGPPTGPTAFIAPVYPFFVAGVFRVFGIESVPAAIFIMLLQTAATVLTIWLMMDVARRLFDARIALVAGLISACSLPLWWIPTIFWDTSLAACGLIALIWMAIRLPEAPSRKAWALFGIYAALLALLTPALLFTMTAVFVWIVWKTTPAVRSRAMLAVLAFVLVFAVWPIRNYRVFHAFIPLRTTVGFELWMGNHPGSTGFLDQSLFPSYNSDELNQYVRMGEVAYTNNKEAVAKSYIVEHPGIFANLTLRRIFRFWTGSGSEHGSTLFIVHAICTSLFGLCGLGLLVRSRRYRAACLFALPLLVFPLPYYITHAEFRYRLLIDPLLTILAAYALAKLFQRLAPQAQFSEGMADERPGVA